MNKRDLVEKIAEDAHLTKVQAGRALEALVEGVQNSLSRGDRVALAGLGTFALTDRKARFVRAPKGGAAIQIPARRVARFTPGIELKAAIGAAPEKPATA
ncbi:MAG: HU family DNA-binding protein [Acidobacteria bacterium]|nr:HU family DNA-binding protein [Acidobacteriota bacterium]MBI3473248.1 HU family DNA-binding protein [Candidatus Solibacter usitatus]